MNDTPLPDTLQQIASISAMEPKPAAALFGEAMQEAADRHDRGYRPRPGEKFKGRMCPATRRPGGKPPRRATARDEFWKYRLAAKAASNLTRSFKPAA